MKCEAWRIRGLVGQRCGIPDPDSPIFIVATSGEYSASADNVIYEPLGKPGNRKSLAKYLDIFLATVIHEVSHEFSLGDLYIDHPGTGYATADWGKIWRDIYLNTDAPGCPRWCSGYKPVSQYPNGKNSFCLDIKDKKSCLAYKKKTDDVACVWSDEVIEYFGTNCIPMWGTGNIGTGCTAGAGCYLGANHGQYSWRPVKNCTDSKMCNARIRKYDHVSLSYMKRAFQCCFSSADATSACSAFRTEITTSLRSLYSNRLGSCGSYMSFGN